MNVTQIESIDAAYSDPPPWADTFDRMEELCRARRREIITAETKRMQLEMFDRRFTDIEAQGADRRNEIVNRMTRAALRQAELEREIVEVAGHIVAEHAAGEMVTA
jgi:hypothetical protein